MSHCRVRFSLHIVLALIAIGASYPAQAQLRSSPMCSGDAPATFGVAWLNLSAISNVLASSGPRSLPAAAVDLDGECADLAPAMEVAEPSEVWAAAQGMASRGCWNAALGQLVFLEVAFPEIADRLALARGDWLIEADRARESCPVFQQAISGQHSTVRMLGRIGRVRCLIHARDPHAESEVTSLARRYPELPHVESLRLELAMEREELGDRSGAVRIYQRLDSMHPGSSEAIVARERLSALQSSGTVIGAFSAGQQIERAERLTRTGPFPLAKETTDAIADSNIRLNSDLRTRLALMRSRLARFESRFDDASRYLAEGSRSASDQEERAARAQRRAELDDAAHASDQERALERIAAVRRGRGLRALSNTQLLRVLSLAAPAQLTEIADQVLAVIATKSLPAPIRFDAAMIGMGAASDARVLALLETIRTSPHMGVSANYHYARMLERMGRTTEALAHFREVIDGDRGRNRFYTMWASQRVAALTQTADPSDSNAPDDYVARPIPESGVAMTDIEMIAVLEPMAIERRSTYPWIGRALALLKMGEHEGATDELHEVYLAWRDSQGRPVRRADFESVARGADRVPDRVTFRQRRDRREITEEERSTIARVSESLGDPGLRLGFTRFRDLESRPRAYENVVRSAAVRYGVDPNLLFAVMRVESVYQRRIISYAGAIGLMQIMPRTGRNIASALGRQDYKTVDLLSAETNIEFAAWYLASLIERFQGRVPLAIASYNGGPHNVRRWMTEHSEDITLDAFLERIPFSQTHRYVRRVLGHYAIYRGQQNLDMIGLQTDLPRGLSTDTVGF